MRVAVLHIILMITSVSLSGQNLLGYRSDQIEKYIKKNHTGMVRDNNSRNDYYRYLKYTDGMAGTTTVYFFLSEDNRCTRIKSMYVHSMRDEVIEELDKTYTKSGNNIWTDRHKGINAVIKLVNEEWFFTVTIEPE